MNYDEFLAKKSRRFKGDGFAPDHGSIPGQVFAWQRQIIEWAVKRGRCALFADTGLGKTIMQLSWADQVVRHTNKPVLVLTPLAVSHQTAREAERFGLGAQVIYGPVPDGPMVHICNYQKLHKLDASQYAGVVLDESSILKSFQGKIRRQLTDMFAHTPYRLACTATPAPNDHLELGNHAEFLGIMPQKEMLSRWFLNDLIGNLSWRLKGHAVKDFWQWVGSWALAIRTPADLGYDATGYILPPLHIRHVSVEAPGVTVPGRLFADASLSATTLHDVMRQTAPFRAMKARELIWQRLDDQWLIWAHTNYEADELRKLVDTEEVRGQDSDEHKERILLGFADGDVKRLLTKPSLAGFGMNWQRCHRMLFVGVDYSYEKFYQAVRRCHRYGQINEVSVDVLSTDMEWRLFDSMAKKQRAHQDMQANMVGLMKEGAEWS